MSPENIRDIIFLIIYSLTALISLIGNSLVCKVAFFTNKSNNHNIRRIACNNNNNTSSSYKKQKFVGILLGSMAISDIICAVTFLIGLCTCCTTTINVIGPKLCLLNKALQLTTFQVSSFVMTIIAIDRCYLIHHPFRQERFVSAWVIVVGIWILGIITIIGTSPSLGYQQYNFGLNLNANNASINNNSYVSSSSSSISTSLVECKIGILFNTYDASLIEQRIRLVIANLAHFWIPLTIIIICYGKLGFTIWKRKNISTDSMNVSQLDNWLANKWKTIRMLIMTVIVFFSCWFPFFIINLISFISSPTQKRPCNQSYLYLLAIWLAFSSCCYNPLIYWWMNEKYRAGLKEIYDFITCNNIIIRKNRSNNSSQITLHT